MSSLKSAQSLSFRIGNRTQREPFLALLRAMRRFKSGEAAAFLSGSSSSLPSATVASKLFGRRCSVQRVALAPNEYGP